MRIFILVVFFCLVSCKEKELYIREGEPLPGRHPQTQEQCRAQPELDWCKK